MQGSRGKPQQPSQPPYQAKQTKMGVPGRMKGNHQTSNQMVAASSLLEKKRTKYDYDDEKNSSKGKIRGMFGAAGVSLQVNINLLKYVKFAAFPALYLLWFLWGDLSKQTKK